jgi:RHS repeat-associated protein
MISARPQSLSRRISVVPLLFTIAIITLSCLPTLAQQISQYDRGTPPQFAAGVSPFGSYISADLGTVNLANGSLNFKIPLGVVGGRGFSIPLTLNYSSKVWSASKDTDTSCTENSKIVAYAVYDDSQSFVSIYNRVAPGWSVGAAPFLKVTGAGIQLKTCSPPSGEGAANYQWALTKLTLAMPDGGEIDFRDDLTEGAPFKTPDGCFPSGPNGTYDSNRGQRWHATDGSGMVFINDVANGVVNGNLSGVVITPSGMRYRFVDTNPYSYQPTVDDYQKVIQCVSITDSNGNTIQISYPNDSTTIYTDQLGRVTTIQHGAEDPQNPGHYLLLLVTLPGYGGPRYIKVNSGTMNQNYRPGIAPQLPVINGDYVYDWGAPHTSLFPRSFGIFAQRIDDQGVLTDIILPDNRSLNFKYNEYGEVAQVTLPTSGVIQYDYAYSNSLPSGNSLGVEISGQYLTCFSLAGASVPEIDRAISARRTLPDGATLESTWTYIYGPQSYNGTSYNCTEVTARSGSGGPVLMNQRHFFLSANRYITAEIGGWVPTGTGYTLWSSGVEWRTEIRDGGGGVISANEQDWSQRATLDWTPVALEYVQLRGQEQPSYDNRESQARNYLNTGGFAKTEIFYDNTNNVRVNNVTEEKEYDYDQTLKRRTVTSYLITNPDNGNINYSTDDIFLLRLPTQRSIYDSGGTERARTVYKYDKYVDDGDNAPLTDYSGVTGHDTNYGAGKTTRGNVTAVGRWLDTDGSTLFTYSRCDTLGNVVSTKDPRGNVTTISYADNFGVGDNPDSGGGGDFGPTFALPTLITSPPPQTGQQPHTAKSQYDFSTGLLTGFKDRNGVITKTEYNDPFDRPTKTTNAKGVTGVETQTAMYYAPQSNPYGVTLANNDMLTAKDRDASGDGILRSWTVTDGFGRTIESWTRHPQGDVKVTTVYDGLGHVSQTSNPYRSGDTSVYTTTTYDLSGRVTALTTPDGATVSTAYSGNQVTVTDQAGKKRRSETDALGKLTMVTEDPGGLNYDTVYLYDVLGNLRKVTQGAQIRWFAYDSLSRLIRAKNPEQDVNTDPNMSYSDPVTGHNGWSMAYSYDANGNLFSKTDARNIATNYFYDAINRPTSRSYTDGTPAVNYFYDAQALPAGAPSFDRGKSTGRLVAVTYGGGSQGNYYGYDSLGRVLRKFQQIGATNYQTQATYNNAGAVTGETYPSGRTVTSNYDQAGRLYSFSGNLGGSAATYADTISYNAAGQMIKEGFGTNTPLYHNQHYNCRLQLADTRLGDSATDEWSWSRGAIGYKYGTTAVATGNDFAYDTDNNGNLRRQNYYVPLASGGYVISQLDDYYYDPLNRIAAVREQQQDANGQTADSVSQAYNYDRSGNRTLDLSGGSSGAVVWVDDALPSGATAGSDGGDGWTWVSSNPSPYSGTVSHQSNIAAGEHQHYFYGATQTLQVNPGDRLYAYVYLDPVNTPSEVELQWNDGSGWEHRGYWGANNLGCANGTASCRYMGPLPATGGWVRLEVPASSVGLEGKTVNGMAFTLYGGRATWDKAGKDNLFAGVTSSPINNNVYAVDAGSNRLTSVNGVTMFYDAAGNQTNDGSGQRTYDGENRMVTATNGGVSSSYTYDADGSRVKRIIVGVETWQIYGIGGELLAEYAVGASPSAPQKEYGYRSGQLLVVWDGGETGDRQLQWLVQDHLGSTRMVVDRSGSLAGIKRHDFAPFGEELAAGMGIRSEINGYSGDSVRQKYTEKERDVETGLDFFEARYFSSLQGRFTSPDPIPMTPDRQLDPQRINLYQYSRNNPLAFSDPTGMELVQLGLHTDADIDRIVNKIDTLIKGGNLPQDVVDVLTKRKESLLIEKEGNKIVQEMLDKLDSVGERQGLKLSDFTLSTDVARDFRNVRILQTLEQFAAVRRGISKQIYIFTENLTYKAIKQGVAYFNSGGFTAGEVRRPDLIIEGGTFLPHEKFHRDVGPSEKFAYKEQRRVLDQFGPGAFMNQQFFTEFRDYLRAKAGENQGQRRRHTP